MTVTTTIVPRLTRADLLAIEHFNAGVYEAVPCNCWLDEHEPRHV